LANRTIRTPEKEAKLLDALRERPVLTSALKRARIGRRTYYEWRDADPLFAQAVKDAIEEGLDALEDALIERGLANDTTAAIFMLKSRRRDIYGDKATVDLRVTMREKVEQLASELGIPADTLMAEAEAVASGAWDAWSPR
jgi:hypothetical protein